MELAAIEADIAEQRIALDRWLNTVYGPGEPREYFGERDCGYENWGAITATAGLVFDNRFTKALSQPSLDSLLFFISRNDERGHIICWLGRIGPLSGVGDLTSDDFHFLCEAALKRSEDFCDYHLAASFHKFPELDKGQVELVKRFFQRDYTYTKRVAIDVLAEKGCPDIPSLARQLWSYDECEFTKLSCLYALKTAGSDHSLFCHYLKQFKEQFDIDKSDYLPTHIQRLES